MLSNQDNKISHPSSHSRPESSSPEEGNKKKKKKKKKKVLSSSTASPPAPPPLTTTTAAAAADAKSGERIRNKKTHNLLDRQIKHASESGASDQISQWTVKIWTVEIRQ
jgi:hypothetical protein